MLPISVSIKSAASLAAIASILSFTPVAFAQTVAAQPAVTAEPVPVEEVAAPVEDSAGGSDIVVTASRVNREGYTAPTPTTVIGSQLLENRAVTNIASILQEVPSFKSTTQPTTNGINQRANGSNYVDLRGLGTSRTLVLVDGHRFVPEMAAGLAGYQVNLNQIPSLMVDRIEVVTGGASAQWGSDAVAGVVNVILKKKFSGIQGEIQGGTSGHGDNHSFRIGLLGGFNFSDDRGNFTAAVDYEKNYGVPDISTRDWGRENYFLVANPCPNAAAVSASCPTGGNGQAANLILPDVQYSNATLGGLISNTALRGTQFDANGNSMPFEYGDYAGSSFMVGGGQPGINYPRFQPIAAPFQRIQTYARASYDLTPTVSLFGEASYSRSRGGGAAIPWRATSTIRSDNAYLPDEIRERMEDLNVSSFTLGHVYDEFTATGRVTNDTIRGVLGLEGEFGEGGNWHWSATGGHGVNKYKQRVFNQGVTPRYAFATDAVLNNGKIVCRATIPGATFNPAAEGCLPLNPFGIGSGAASPGASYVVATTAADIDYRQTFFDAEMSGEPFSTWAGPVSIAFGAEYRHESEDAVSDSIANANGFFANNSATFSGKFSVKEGFVEAVVPILKDSPLGQSLDLNGAVRYADYSTSGGVMTWKAGLTYKPFEGMLLRAARSRDIRAPNIFELNIPPSGRAGTIRYDTLQVNVLTLSSGNPNLEPEKADTLTLGFSYQPAFVPGLAFSLDYFDIDTKDVISTLSAQDVADLCLAGGDEYCDLITYDPDASVPTPLELRTPFLNLASVEIAGLDGQVTYRLPLDRISADTPGAVTFSFNGTYTMDAKINLGTFNALTIDRSGENGPKNQFSAARFRFTAGLTYSDKRFMLSAQARHVSGGDYDVTYTASDINDNHIPGRTYFDLSTSFEVMDGITLFGVVNNIFDRDPPPDPTDNASPTNAVYYDTIGRMFKGGVRFKF